MKSTIGVAVLVVQAALMTVSCRYSEAKDPELVNTKSESPPSKPDTAPAHEAEGPSDPPAAATGDTCDDQSCAGSEECCKGYACGFDPERSKVQRYCLKQ